MQEVRARWNLRKGAAVVLALALGGAACASRSGTPSVTPAAMIDLGELPSDSARRNELLESTQARPGPEDRKSLTPLARQVETAAATAAAVLGILFSKTPNVLLGAGGPMDENLLFESGDRPRGQTEPGTKEDDDEREAEEPIDAGQLVPWVKLPRPDDPHE